MAELNASPKNHRIVYDKEQDSLQTLDTSKFKKTADAALDLLREAQKNSSAPLLLDKASDSASPAKASLEQIEASPDSLHAGQGPKKQPQTDKKKAETARPKLNIEPAQANHPNATAKQPAVSARKINKEQTPLQASQKPRVKK